MANLGLQAEPCETMDLGVSKPLRVLWSSLEALEAFDGLERFQMAFKWFE